MIDSRLDPVLAGPRLPSLPAVAVRVLQLTESPDASLAEIAEAIEFDQALVVKLLRTVNSSYYGLQKPCGSIHQAMAYLGSRAVRSLVLGFTLTKSLDGGGDLEVDFHWRSYWRRAVRMAASARMIAAAAKRGDPDEAQVSALLADMGMVALYRAYGDRYLQTVDLIHGNHRELPTVEQRVFSTDHAEVSAEMARRWGLPPAVCDAVGGHHAPPERTSPPETLVVGVAALAAAAMDASAPEVKAGAEVTFSRACSDSFSILPAAAERLLANARAQSVELANCLELDIGPERDPAELTARAEAARHASSEGGAGAGDGACAAGFEEHLAAAFARAADRSGIGLAIFEQDNSRATDSRRTPAEEMVMARLYATLKDALDGIASVHRLSHATFAAIFELAPGDTAEQGALRKVDQVRRETANRRLAAGRNGPLTVSAGVAIHGSRRFTSPDSLLRAAMLALGAAQREGRNRVGHYRQAYDPLAA